MIVKQTWKPGWKPNWQISTADVEEVIYDKVGRTPPIDELVFTQAVTILFYANLTYM
jgi:hypothetical protein